MPAVLHAIEAEHLAPDTVSFGAIIPGLANKSAVTPKVIKKTPASPKIVEVVLRNMCARIGENLRNGRRELSLRSIREFESLVLSKTRFALSRKNFREETSMSVRLFEEVIPGDNPGLGEVRFGGSKVPACRFIVFGEKVGVGSRLFGKSGEAREKVGVGSSFRGFDG